jgi:hypothetical protein
LHAIDTQMLGNADVGEATIGLNFGEGQNRLPRESTKSKAKEHDTGGEQIPSTQPVCIL